MNREYTGGLFWDVLLLTQYNEYWEDFFYKFIRVLPCKKCVGESIAHHNINPVPKFKSNEEKNEWLWEQRVHRGGKPFRDDIADKGYSLEGWINQFKDKPFTRIAQ